MEASAIWTQSQIKLQTKIQKEKHTCQTLETDIRGTCQWRRSVRRHWQNWEARKQKTWGSRFLALSASGWNTCNLGVKCWIHFQWRVIIVFKSVSCHHHLLSEIPRIWRANLKTFEYRKKIESVFCHHYLHHHHYYHHRHHHNDHHTLQPARRRPSLCSCS